MVEFVQNYGLWIALAGVFATMHWFGKGCCGRSRQQAPIQGAAGVRSQGLKDE